MENNELVQQLLILASFITPVAAGLVELVKKTVNVKVNYLPILSFGFAVLIAFLAWPFTDLDVTLRLWAGGLAGLGGVGLFEAFKQRQGTTKGGE